jgi:hypothetical protein
MSPLAHDVFISYSSVDKRIADAVCKQLEADGLGCWVAPRDIIAGRKWSEAIIDALAGANVMVLILSAHSIASEQVEREVERAAARRLPIIPFRVEDVPMSKVLEYFISTPHWLNAWSAPLEPHLAELSKAAAALLSKSPGAKTATAASSQMAVARSVGGASTSAAPAKVCCKCGVDVSQMKRTRDASGNYYCDPCLKTLVASRQPKASPATVAPAPVVAASTAQTLSPETTGKLDAALLARATEELAVIVGPIAKVLVRRAAATAGSPAALREMLAREIPSEADRMRFLRNLGK